MRKMKIASLAILAFASMGAFAAATDDLSVNLSVNADTGHIYRGNDLSPNTMTVGGKIGLTHATGFGVEMSTQSGTKDDLNFMRSQIGVNYGFEAVPGVKAKVGVQKNLLTGFDGASENNSTELVGSAEYNGIKGSLAYAIDGNDSVKDSVYGELGYTYKFGSAGQYNVGADLGYTFVSDKMSQDGAKDGLSAAQIRAGYQINKNLDLGVSYQLNLAEDASGAKASGNEKFAVKLGYQF